MKNLFPWYVSGNPNSVEKHILWITTTFKNGINLAFFTLIVCEIIKWVF